MKFNQLLATLFVSCLFPNLMTGQASSVQKNVNNKLHAKSFNKYLTDAKVDSGYFISTKDNGTMCFELTDHLRRNKQHYMIENCFALAELREVNRSTLSVFRNSGELLLNKTDRDEGDFTFIKNSPLSLLVSSSYGLRISRSQYGECSSNCPNQFL